MTVDPIDETSPLGFPESEVVIAGTFPMIRTFVSTELNPGGVAESTPVPAVGLYQAFSEYPRRAPDVDLSTEDERTLRGWFATVNGKNIWQLMKGFESFASVYSADDSVYAKILYADRILMTMMTTWINVRKPRFPILGDLLFKKNGDIQAYVNNTDGWVDVGRLNLTGDWSEPSDRRPVKIYAVNRQFVTLPVENVDAGSFAVSKFAIGGAASGLFVYKFYDDAWHDVSLTDENNIEFTKHIEISIAGYPGEEDENGNTVAPQFVRSGEASASWTSYNETEHTDPNYFALPVTKWKSSDYTNRISIKWLSTQDPTTFVFDASALLPMSPMNKNEDLYSANARFLFLREGSSCGYTVQKKSEKGSYGWTKTYTADWSNNDAYGWYHHDSRFSPFSITPGYPDLVESLVNQPSGGQGSTLTRTESWHEVYTYSIPIRASRVMEDQIATFPLDLLTSFTIPYDIIHTDSTIAAERDVPMGMILPGYTAESQIWRWPEATVSRNTWAHDPNGSTTYSTDFPRFFVNSGSMALGVEDRVYGKVLSTVVFDTNCEDEYEDMTYEQLPKDDSGNEVFPHSWAYDTTNHYRIAMLPIQIGYGIISPMTTGTDKKFVRVGITK